MGTQDMSNVELDTVGETLRQMKDSEYTYGQALMGTVVNKRTYEAWAYALDSVESAKVAKIEKLVSARLGMPAPKGVKEWRLFVAAVVEAYVAQLDDGARPSLLKGAAKRHAEYLSSIVIASNCGICGPREQAVCGSCYPADSNGYALVERGKTIDELADDMLSVEETEAARAHALPDDPEITAAIDRAYQAQRAASQPDAMTIILNTVTKDSGHIHGGVTSGEIVAAGANRSALTRAVKAGWVTMLAVDPCQAEPDRAPRYYLSGKGEVERDRRNGTLASVEDQSAAPTRVTTVKATVVLAFRHPRVSGFNRRKPSLSRRGWK